MMLQRILSLMLTAGMLVGCASVSKDAGTENKQSPAENQPSQTNSTVPEGAYPPDVKSGIAEVDRVMEAVATQNAETLGSLVKLLPTSCKANPMPGEVPCPDGKPDGTMIDAFPWSTSCAPQQSTELDSARKFVLNRLTSSQAYVYAVYRTGGPTGATYMIALDNDTSDEFSLELGVDRGGAIVSLTTMCQKVATFADPSKIDFVLPPKK